jgi:O-antigen/teichoic acid export membrane protein
VNFRKELNFGADFTYGIAAKLCSFVATVPLAFLLRSYLALVLGMVVTAAARLALSYTMHPYRPTLALSRWRETLSFSVWLLFANILGSLYRRADTFLISKLAGAVPLGVYTIAHEISSLPTSELVAPIRRAILPGYAKIAREPERLRATFVESFALIVLFSTPIAAGIGLTADPVVRLFLGSKWLDAIPLIQILALFGLFRSCTANVFPAYAAIGQPRLEALVTFAGAVVGVPLLTWGTYRWGVVGTAWTSTVAAAVHATINLAMASRVLKLSLKTVLSAIWRTAGAVAAMTVLVFLVGNSWPEANAPVALAAKLTALAAVGGASYVVVHLALWRICGRPEGAERYVLAAVQGRVPGFRLKQGAG